MKTLILTTILLVSLAGAVNANDMILRFGSLYINKNIIYHDSLCLDRFIREIPDEAWRADAEISYLMFDCFSEHNEDSLMYQGGYSQNDVVDEVMEALDSLWDNCDEDVDSTTVQLHISADALMIRMPSNHWFVLVEDSVAHYKPESGAIRIPVLNPTPRIVEYYTRRLRFAPTDSIPKTSSSIVYIDWTGERYGLVLQQGSNTAITLYDAIRKEKDK